MLRIIQVGHSEASERYIRNKMKAVKNAGMECELVSLAENTTTEALERILFETSLIKEISAVIVQLPLPEHIDKDRVFDAISPMQDIDGLNPMSDYMPITPCVIYEKLKDNFGSLLPFHNVVILGRSKLVGLPLANMLIEEGCTVSVCNSKTTSTNKYRLCKTANIIISAVGKRNAVVGEMLSDDFGQFIIDVGINRDVNGKLCGDVSHEARQKCTGLGGYVSPVPGGVGKWTVEGLVERLKKMEAVDNAEN